MFLPRIEVIHCIEVYWYKVLVWGHYEVCQKYIWPHTDQWWNPLTLLVAGSWLPLCHYMAIAYRGRVILRVLPWDLVMNPTVFQNSNDIRFPSTWYTLKKRERHMASNVRRPVWTACSEGNRQPLCCDRRGGEGTQIIAFAPGRRPYWKPPAATTESPRPSRPLKAPSARRGGGNPIVPLSDIFALRLHFAQFKTTCAIKGQSA